MREELADGDVVLALLRELRPVPAHPLLVVEPAARVGDGHGHRRQPLGRRVDDDHRVPLPGLTRLLVSDSAPEVDDLLTPAIGAAGAAEFVAMSEVVGKRLAHRLEATSYVSLYRRCCSNWHGLSSSGSKGKARASATGPTESEGARNRWPIKQGRRRSCRRRRRPWHRPRDGHASGAHVEYRATRRGISAGACNLPLASTV